MVADGDDAAVVARRPSWLLRLAYDGAAYNGWQLQPNCPTIQGALNDALTQLYVRSLRRRVADAALAGEPVADPLRWQTRGCSRTDARVHALAQMVSLQPPESPTIPPLNAVRALNGFLPPDIRVQSIEERPADFQARFEAAGKGYTYVIHRGLLRSPFLTRYATPTADHLDLDAMRAAAAMLVGTHDFDAFTANIPGQDPDDTIRTLDRFIIREAGALVLVTVVGERFMYKMVRRLVGLLIAVGEGKYPVTGVPALLVKGVRNGDYQIQTAQPQGLFLEEVFFEPAVMAAWQPGPLPFLGFLGLPPLA